MHDLQLVGVHEDGEHLLLADAEGTRYLLAVDEALRAAVRRDRAHLGQLQIEIEGGLRPRDVQARIRAGASAEEVAGLAGWSVEKVRRYEGPVLAERENIAQIARTVRLRRRGAEAVTLGVQVHRRLSGRGVDVDHVRWDSWRTHDGPWTVVATFPAGGRERSARWHLDLAARSVVPADDEARWLSEDEPAGEGPLAGARLSAVPLAATVYDVEADGGVGSEPGRAAGTSGPLDLVGAMRSRRQAGRPAGRRPTSGSEPSDVPGGDPRSPGLHPAGRKRPRPEPLELDPTLMDDPPAAHPTTSAKDTTAAPEPYDDPVMAPSPPLPSAGNRWPLAEAMRRTPPPALLTPREPGEEPDPIPLRDAHHVPGVLDDARHPDEQPVVDVRSDPGSSAESGRHRGAAAPRKSRRASVPSWDDIMFGAKHD